MSAQPPSVDKRLYPNLAGTYAVPPAYNPAAGPPPSQAPVMKSPAPLPVARPQPAAAPAPAPAQVMYAQPQRVMQPVIMQPQTVYYAPPQPTTSTVIVQNPGVYHPYYYQQPVTTTTTVQNGTTTTTYIQQPGVVMAPMNTYGLGYTVNNIVNDVNRMFNPGAPYVYRRW